MSGPKHFDPVAPATQREKTDQAVKDGILRQWASQRPAAGQVSLLTTRKTINILVHFDAESDDAAIGYDLAQEVWLAHGQGGTHVHEAARQFAEGVQTYAATASAEEVTSYLFGAACLFLEVAQKGTPSEVTP